VVEYGAFERVGGTTNVEVDTRIINATNADMPQGKLEAIRDRHKILVEKAMQAKKSKRARDQVGEADGTNVFLRFEQMLHRVDRMVAGAELARTRNTSLDKEFADLETDEELEAELAEFQSKSGKRADEVA
jgi:phage shock protein A